MKAIVLLVDDDVDIKIDFPKPENKNWLDAFVSYEKTALKQGLYNFEGAKEITIGYKCTS